MAERRTDDGHALVRLLLEEPNPSATPVLSRSIEEAIGADETAPRVNAVFIVADTVAIIHPSVGPDRMWQPKRRVCQPKPDRRDDPRKVAELDEAWLHVLPAFLIGIVILGSAGSCDPSSGLSASSPWQKGAT